MSSLFSNEIGTGLGDAPSTGNSMYDQLFNANPYRNLTYNKSFLQTLLGTLGFRTDADRWREDAQVNSAEYDSSIYSLMQQNNFNDPSSQASRERSAGLNPDLLGIGDVSEAAQPADDPNGMSQNQGDEFSDFGESVASVFSRAVAICKDFKSLEQISGIIDSQNIDNAVKMTGAIDDFLVSLLTAEDMASYDTYKERVFGMAGNDFPENMAAALGFSKRQIPQFRRLFHDRILSIAGDKTAYSRFKERIDAMSGSKQSQVSPFSFGVDGAASDYSTQESGVDIMVSGLAEAQKESLKYKAEADRARSHVEQQEASYLELSGAGVASGETQMQEYSTKKIVAKWNATCARIKKDMIEKLETSAKSGDMFAKALLYSWSLDDLAKFNVSVGAQVKNPLGNVLPGLLNPNMSGILNGVL